MYTLITGASSGIGLELAKIAAREGRDLILVARNVAAMEKLADQLRKNHQIQVQVMRFDLSQIGSAQQLWNDIQSQNWSVEVLINNAGFGDHGEFYKADLHRQTEMIHLNITTLVELTRFCLPPMVARKSGRVLNVASTAAFQAGPYMSVYYATKAFVLSFSEALQIELAGLGVTVTALCPGPTETGFAAVANIGDSPLFKLMKIPTGQDVAEYGYRAMNKGQTLAIHGTLNKAMVFAGRFTPRFVLGQIVKSLQGSRHS